MTAADRRSPLDAAHRALGAKLVPFGGWEMPLSYPAGTIAEHKACRGAAVAFDVSHLGTVRLQGPDAKATIQGALTNDLGKIAPGRAQYTHLLDPDDASVVDDIIVWWVGEGRFDVMPNASNTERVRDAIGGTDVTEQRAIIAVQGPTAREQLKAVAPEAAGVPHFAVTARGCECLPQHGEHPRPEDFQLPRGLFALGEFRAAQLGEQLVNALRRRRPASSRRPLHPSCGSPPTLGRASRPWHPGIASGASGSGCRWCVGLIPRGVPPSRTVLTASSSSRRAWITALSAGPRCSRLRSTTGPMLSWIARSCVLIPSIPVNVSVFCTWRSIR